MAVEKVVAVKVAAGTVAAMVAAETAAAKEGCQRSHQRSIGRRTVPQHHSNHRCDRYCPALQHAAHQDCPVRTPPTSRSAGRRGCIQ